MGEMSGVWEWVEVSGIWGSTVERWDRIGMLKSDAKG
jgi:hypothetical protein